MRENTTTSTTRVIRLTRLIFHVVSGVLQAVVYPYFSHATQQRMMQNWAAGILSILNIKLHYTGQIPDQNHRKILFVANHVSWLDICAIMAASPTQFVAKSEIRHWPVIGFLCRRIGTLFIERTKRSDTARINEAIGHTLATGERVCVFPEGATSDGTQVHHFHASLLQSAIIADAWLLPITIRYLDSTGQLCQDAAYTDVSMLTSLQKILRQPTIESILNCSEPISSSGKNRRELARLSEAAITHHLLQPAYHNEPGKPSYLPNA